MVLPLAMSCLTPGACLIQESLFDGHPLSIALVACSAVINRQAAASLDVLSYVRGGPADA
jgi:hypothetical protein